MYDSKDRIAATEAPTQTTASGVTIVVDRPAPDRVTKALVSRTSRTARKLMAPYVPPAKRLRDQNKLGSERKKPR